jgi:hypothetical protein
MCDANHSLVQGRNHSSEVGGTTLTYSGFTEKFWGDQHIDGPMDQKFGGTCSPGPHGGCAYALVHVLPRAVTNFCCREAV